ncbi:MAG: glutaredoxin family protein [Anaerolineae bacterium]
MERRNSVLCAAIWATFWLWAFAGLLVLPAVAQGCTECQEIKQKQYTARVGGNMPAMDATAVTRPTHSPSPTMSVVRVVLYWAEGCGHCHEVLDRILPQLQARYGPQLEVRLIEVVSLEDISAFFDLAEAYGHARGRASVPFLLIGGRALMGVEQIERELPGLIQAGLAAGGTDWPAPPARQGKPQAAEISEDTCGFTVPCTEETAAAANPSALRPEKSHPAVPLAAVVAAIFGATGVIGGAVGLRRLWKKMK